MLAATFEPFPRSARAGGANIAVELAVCVLDSRRCAGRLAGHAAHAGDSPLPLARAPAASSRAVRCTSLASATSLWRWSHWLCRCAPLLGRSSSWLDCFDADQALLGGAERGWRSGRCQSKSTLPRREGCSAGGGRGSTSRKKACGMYAEAADVAIA